MTFWSAVLKPGDRLKVRVEPDMELNLSQASLAVAENTRSELISLFAKQNNRKRVIGTLSFDFYMIKLDKKFQHNFVLSHNSEHGSVHLCGYKEKKMIERITPFDHSIDEPLLPPKRSDFYEKMKKFVVLIRIQFLNNEWYTGGGVVINEDGAILTAAHLFHDEGKIVAKEIEVYYDQFKCEIAVIIEFNLESDLALLQPKNPTKKEKAILGMNEDIRIGMELWSICHSQGLPYCFSLGYISSLNCKTRDVLSEFPHFREDLRLIQCSNSGMRSGASGCPVFSSSGFLIGISSIGNDSDELLIHLSEIKRFLDSPEESFEENDLSLNINVLKIEMNSQFLPTVVGELSPKENFLFYEKMKSTVVSVRTLQIEKGESSWYKGVGVIINGDGMILTSAQLVKRRDGTQYLGKGKYIVQIAQYGSREEYISAEVIDMNIEKNLVVLSPKDRLTNMSYASVGKDNICTVGSKVATICHGCSSNFFLGYISYVGQNIHELEYADTNYTYYASNLLVNQLSGFNEIESGLGAPVFDTTGAVIGILTHSEYFLDYAITVKDLNAFFSLKGGFH